MTIQITDRQMLAIRKHAAPLTRKLGGLESYEPHALQWQELNDHHNAVLSEARAVLEKITDGMGEAQTKDLEQAHDGLMALYDEIEGEKNERGKTGNKGPRAHGGNSNRPTYAPGSMRGDGSSGDMEPEGTEVHALRRGQTFVEWAEQRGLRNPEARGIGVGAYLRALVTGPRNDLERRALSEGTNSAGGFTTPDVLAARMIDRLRAASVLVRAGARVVPLTSDTNLIAKVLTDPAPGWRAENAAIAESDPTFGNVTLTPRSLGVLVKVSRELLEDSLNIDTALPNIMAKAMALEFDRVGLLGTGTAPQPRGVANFAGLTTNGFAGGALTGYGPLITARTALRTANSDVSAYVMAPRDEGTLAGLTDANDQPLMVPPAIASLPMHTTTSIPVNGGGGMNESKIIAGNWPQLLLGIRNEIRIEILRERYADNHQFGFIAFMRADVAAEHEAAFTVLSGITP